MHPRLPRLILSLALLAVLAGCSSARGWVRSGTGVGTAAGASVTVPLGKGR